MEKQVKFIIIGVLFILGMLLGVTGCESIPKDHTGILNVSLFGQKGYQPEKVYTQGTYFVGWGRDFGYVKSVDTTKTYEASVLDKGGIKIDISVKVTSNVIKNEVGKLIVKYGTDGGHMDRLNATVGGAIKDVLGQYTYVEIYSTKRSAVENSIKERIMENIKGTHVEVSNIEIVDVDPDETVMATITALEKQNKTNELKEKQRIAAKYEADARIEKARGDSSLIITAQYQARSMQIMKQEFAKGNSKDYIDYTIMKEYADKGISPYGQNNTFVNGKPNVTQVVGK